MIFMFMKSPKLERASFQHSMTYGYSKYLEEQLLPQCLLIKHLILQIILSVTDIKKSVIQGLPFILITDLLVEL